MKLEKKYATLIAVIIILIFLFAFSYFSKFSFLNFKPPIATAGGETPTNVETGEGENPPTVIAAKKTFSFASASCTVSGSVDIVRFKIQAGEYAIGAGEMAVILDGSGAAFKDSQGNKLNAVSLNANSISDEFSYTTTDHRPTRKIEVAAPSGALERIVECS